jgi:CheY-like chemotaxis protein
MEQANILVADPSPTVQRVCQLVLGRGGYRVHCVADASGVSEQLAAGQFDVMLVDAGLYERHQELAARARRAGLAERVVLLAGMQARHVDYNLPVLAKPFTPDQLVRRVAQLTQFANDPSAAVAVESSATVLTKDWTFDPGILETSGTPVMWCRMAAVPFPELLQMLRALGWDAQVALRNGAQNVSVTMRSGRVDFVQAHGVGDGFRLGRFLIASGAIGREELEAFFGMPERPALPLGQALLTLGLIDEAGLLEAVRRQTAELIYEVLRWSDGEAVVVLGAEESELVAHTGLGLVVEELLAEGFRRVQEWNRLESQLPSLDAVLEPNLLVINGFELNRLSGMERRVLKRLRRPLSMRQVLDDAEEAPYDLCRAIHVLVGTHLVRVRRPDEGGQL